jgi:sugar phosphate isomerase/epimerase
MEEMTYSIGVFLHITTSDRDEWEDEIRFIHSLRGLGHIELWMERPEIALSEAQWLKEACGSRRLIVHAPFLDLSMVSHHGEIRTASLQVLQRCLHTSRFIGAELVTIHAGSYSFRSLRDVRADFARGYQELVNSSDDKVTICLENVPRGSTLHQSYPISVEEFKWVKDLIPHIWFTLDIGHCIRNGEDYRPFLLQHAGSVGNIHLHNAFSGGADHLGLQKAGDLDLAELIFLLQRTHYSGFLSIEALGREDVRESWEILREAIDSPVK